MDSNTIHVSYDNPLQQLSTAPACYSITVRDICVNNTAKPPLKTATTKERASNQNSR